jgi:hypothetical protein
MNEIFRRKSRFRGEYLIGCLPKKSPATNISIIWNPCKSPLAKYSTISISSVPHYGSGCSLSTDSFYLCLYSPCGPWPLFFLNLYTVGKTPWMRDQPVAWPLSTHRTTQTQNNRTQTSMPLVEFESKIAVFEGL